MCDWIRESAVALEPLYRLLRETVLKSDYINTDDTPTLFKNASGGGTGKGHMWVYLCCAKSDPPTNILQKYLMFFEFSRNWNSEHPINTLKHFKGYLQSDGYSGFLKVAERNDVTAIGCWSHTRRKFFEAAEIGVKEAEGFVTLINILYRIEHCMEKLKKCNRDEEDILKLRRKRATRVMNRFFKKAKETFLLPKSPLGKALTYALNHEKALRQYTEQMRFLSDNNIVENALRPLCLGKKNYMFFGDEGGGKTAAILYSLIASCRVCKINPFEYFKDVLARINSHPYAKLDELLPHKWGPTTR